MSLGWGAMGAGGFVRGHTPHTLGCSYSASGTTTALPVQLPARSCPPHLLPAHAMCRGMGWQA
eukprot:scaffold44701_cov17-Tisochrysis_lutea.AAC.1